MLRAEWRDLPVGVSWLSHRCGVGCPRVNVRLDLDPLAVDRQAVAPAVIVAIPARLPVPLGLHRHVHVRRHVALCRVGAVILARWRFGTAHHRRIAAFILHRLYHAHRAVHAVAVRHTIHARAVVTARSVAGGAVFTAAAGTTAGHLSAAAFLGNHQATSLSAQRLATRGIVWGCVVAHPLVLHADIRVLDGLAHAGPVAHIASQGVGAVAAVVVHADLPFARIVTARLVRDTLGHVSGHIPASPVVHALRVFFAAAGCTDRGTECVGLALFFVATTGGFARAFARLRHTQRALLVHVFIHADHPVTVNVEELDHLYGLRAGDIVVEVLTEPPHQVRAIDFGPGAIVGTNAVDRRAIRGDGPEVHFKIDQVGLRAAQAGWVVAHE